MVTTAPDQTRTGRTGADHPGRDGDQPSRPRAGLRALVVAAAAGALLVGGALWVTRDDAPPQVVGNALMENQQQAELGRGQGQQVLGGDRVPGQPTVQRLKHDNVVFTVTVAPARPGPNLVRIDAAGPGHDHGASDALAAETDASPGRSDRPVMVGTPEMDADDALVAAEPRPGTEGLWAVVDLPPGQGSIVVSHGPRHRVPFAVATGDEQPSAEATDLWTGPDGPECLAAATATVLAGGEASSSCPASTLTDADASAVESLTTTLVERGVEEIALDEDDSPRSVAAAALVREVASENGVEVVSPDAPAGDRSALLVVSGWSEAASDLAAAAGLPMRQQTIRNDGTWLAPWLLAPGVVDSTLGAVLPLDFDIRSEAAQAYSQTLGEYLPGQSPTASGYAAWRATAGEPAEDLRLYAASRTAFMPKMKGHEGHETEVAWFPGGTVTPVQ